MNGARRRPLEVNWPAGTTGGCPITKVAINGFGRIGRNFLRASLDRRAALEIVALNDLGDLKTMAHLLQFDSILGRFPEEIAVDSDTISVGEHCVRALSVPGPADLPWRELGVDVVVEATGRFEERNKAQAHLDAGAAVRVCGPVKKRSYAACLRQGRRPL